MVVFGDTQDLVDTRAKPEVHDGLRVMIDWVLENREAQHIDFVLHVGDAIQRGLSLPLSPECLDPAGRCDVERKWTLRDRQYPCGCLVLPVVDEEWRRFNRQWRRLDGQIPYAIVQGNHDNLGVTDPEAQLDRPGFAAHYGPSHYRSIPGSGLVGSHRDAKGLSLAWRFALGERQVLVIGSADTLSPEGVDWARSTLDDHRGLPVIALAHRFFAGVPPDEAQPRRVWRQLVMRHPDRFALAIWGHVSLGEVRFIELGPDPLLRIRSNWQGHPSDRTFLNLIRFYPGPEGRDEVEVLAFDPVRGAQSFEEGLDRRAATRGRTWLPRRPLSLD